MNTKKTSLQKPNFYIYHSLVLSYYAGRISMKLSNIHFLSMMCIFYEFYPFIQLSKVVMQGKLIAVV